MGAVFDDHVAAADIAGLVRNLVRNLYLLKLLLRPLHRFVQIRIEVGDYRLPFHLSLLDAVEKRLHIGREIHVHNTGKSVLHHAVDHLPELRHIQASVFLHNVSSGQDCCDGRRIRTGTPDSKLFKGMYQGSLRIVGQRLGEVLFSLKALPPQLRGSVNLLHQRIVFLLLLLLGVNAHKAVKNHPGG